MQGGVDLFGLLFILIVYSIVYIPLFILYCILSTPMNISLMAWEVISMGLIWMVWLGETSLACCMVLNHVPMFAAALIRKDWHII